MHCSFAQEIAKSAAQLHDWAAGLTSYLQERSGGKA
jgi:hypothetical protein